MTPAEDPLTPLQTGWPAMACALVLLLGLGLAGRSLWPRRSTSLALLAVAVVALLVRLGLLPALDRHVYDGHEADYWDLFRGERQPTRGGTVLYPAMQWGWWLLGRVLPAEPAVPVVLMALWGSASAAVLGAAVARLSVPLAGVLAAGLVALHPVHAAWSSSAYNVILPWGLGALALLATASLVRPVAPLRPRQAAGLGLVLGAALALVVATRLEAVAWAGPCGLLLLATRGAGASPWRERAPALPGLALGLALAGFAAWPLLFPGEVPGAGERALAFRTNWDLLRPYEPFDTLPALALVVLGAVLAARRWPLPTAALAALAVGNHLLLSTFDDYGDRHALTGLAGLAWAVGAGALASTGQARRLGAALAAAGLLVTASGLPAMRAAFYADDHAFLSTLEAPPWADLPVYGLDRVPTAVAPPGQCGLVAEDPRVARDPPLSHFNLLDPVEAQALRGPDGCLRWCADLQDWRWSSRGVRDRARRLHHLYETRPVAVVRDQDSGYACQVWQVGRRRR
ncbi:hypothetical protein L6R53_30940 [Myxococcota bacterium]|nr:hypothetical protein [Myxococcota bacterium]